MSDRERTLCAWCAASPDGRDSANAATNWGLCRDCLRRLLESVLESAHRPRRRRRAPSPPPALH